MSDKPTKKARPSFTVVWEFRVKPGKERGFELAYGPEGEWVRLFRHSADYLGTELLRDRRLRLCYLTLDRWSSRPAYLRFKKENRQAYQAIDAKCEAFTTRERLIGEFDSPSDRLGSCPEPAAGAVPGRSAPSPNPAGRKRRLPYPVEARTRPATVADIRGMIALERASHSAAHWPEPTYGRLFSADAPARIAVVIEDHDAALQGFAIARLVGEEGELENIVVDRKRRHQGLGTRLLEKIIEGSRSQNASRLFLEVRESNPAARALYEKCGFVLSGRRRAYYTSPSEDAVVYTREL